MMMRLLAFLVVIVAFVLSTWASGGSIGASSECVNDDCLVAASSSALSIVTAIVLLLFLVFYPRHEEVPDLSKAVGVWRRFGAFFLDFALAILIASPIVTLPILFAEASHSGAFVWSFHRDFSRPTDSLYLAPAAFAMFLVLFLYFYLHARIGRATIGQYILGFRIRPADGNDAPKHGMRVVLSFMGLCVWPVSAILALCHPRKAFWWDSATATNAIRMG